MTIKRLTAFLSAAAVSLMLLAGCAVEEEGVDLAVCVGAAPATLDPIYAQEAGDQTILAHLYENLMRVTVDVSGRQTIANGMAKSVDETKNRDGTVTYTFRLRSAKWSDGRAVKASDFVYAWRRLADPNTASPFASLLSTVAGYAEARAAGDMELLQVIAKNDSTLEVTLSGPTEWFLREVCTSTAAMPLRQDVVQRLKAAAEAEAEKTGQTALRWWYDPTALVTNGPYLASVYQEGETLSAAASDRYYGSRTGPETITFRFADTAEDAWELYGSQFADVVWPLPESRMEELARSEGWTPMQNLRTYTLFINNSHVLMADAAVREALCLSIARPVLAEAAGSSARPAEGLVPPGVPESEEKDFRTSGGALLKNEDYEEQRTTARAVLGDAGYESGEGLGELEYLYVDEGSNAAVAGELCQMWREILQAQVTPRAVTAQELTAALRGGEYTLAGSWVTAPGNDAECFLNAFVSSSPINRIRYTNSAYDTLMTVAVSADGTARLGCLHDAEELLLLDYALAPLYTEISDYALRETLTGVCQDPRGWFSFAHVTAKPV